MDFSHSARHSLDIAVDLAEKFQAQVYLQDFDELVTIPSLHALYLRKDSKEIAKPEPLTFQSWRAANEVRDLFYETQEETEHQVSRRKKAGTMFRYVFDEGAFYTPNLGYTKREFREDLDEETVVLQVGYDVYPQNSMAGVYMKTRDLDLSKVKQLTFEAKAVSETSDAELKLKRLPQMFRVELKKQRETVLGFAVKPVETDWRIYAFDFNAQKETLIDEVVLVFENTPCLRKLHQVILLRQLPPS